MARLPPLAWSAVECTQGGSGAPRSGLMTTTIVDADWPGSGNEDTRRRIVDSAHECIREVGIKRMTMEAVAVAAEVSRAGLYRYFPNKQVLVDAVLVRNG